MVPKMKRSLGVWVCGLSVVVRTQALWWNTFMPSMHSSGGGVYEAGISLSFSLLFPISLCHSHSLSLCVFSPISHSLPWQRRYMASASHFVGRVWNPTLAPGVTFQAWLKCPPPPPCPAVTRLRWDRRSGSKAELFHRARRWTPFLWCLHNFRTCWRTLVGESTSRHTIKAHLHLFDRCWARIGRWAPPWPSINLGDLPQALCSLFHSHSEDSVSVEPGSGFPLYTQEQIREAVSERKGMVAMKEWVSLEKRR